MKLSIQRETLLKPLQLAASIAERRPSLPILANVMMVADPATLTIIGSDSEIELVGKIPLNDRAESGAITVPARKFLDICRSLPDYSILELELVQPGSAARAVSMEGASSPMSQLQIRCGRSKFLLATLPAEEFPITPEAVPTGQFSISQGLLSELLKQTYFAMAQQDVRHYLNGALLELSANQLAIVAADGHRLAVSRLPIETEHQAQLIIPRKAVLELLKLLDNPEAMAEIILSATQLRIITQEYVLTTKIIDSKFPDYQRVIPRDGNKVIEMDRDVLKQTLARTSILAHEKHRGIRLGLKQDSLLISTHNPEQEQAEEELEITYNGEPIEIGFNVSYLIDVLNTIPSGKVTLTLTDGNSSALLKGADAHTESLYVVMPLRL